MTGLGWTESEAVTAATVFTMAVTASLGFVPLPVWPGTATDWDAALRIADYAVYCSKDAGRDAWTGFVGGEGGPESDDRGETVRQDHLQSRHETRRWSAGSS